jgi:hypothetical protein
LNQNAITGTPQGPSDTTLALQIGSGSQTITVSCELTIPRPRAGGDGQRFLSVSF